MTRLGEEEIKNAIANKLLEIAPECAIYKEAVSVPLYPHFFVTVISLSDTEDRRKRHILSYQLNVRYRVKSDPSTDLKLEQDLDAMALRLMAGFNIIDCEDMKVKCLNKHSEKVDGVLHFFTTIDVQVMLKDTEAETVKQGKLDVEIELEVKR